jgi:FlaA1/EpsC-like NDP-sugar epimerase
LLGTNVTGTGHPMIMRAEEECLSYQKIQALLQDLRGYCDDLDCDGISRVLNTAVSGFGEHRVRHDHLWRKRENLGRSQAAPSNVKELFREKP